MMQPHKNEAASFEPARLKDLAVSATGFVFDPRSGQSFSINHSGVATLECLREGLDVNATAQHLALRYTVPEEVTRSAVEGFLRQLGRYLS
ncbi:MAG: PqqD family peptide modification chaperone [Rhodospirillales bacterium]|nr:PqqD family peptide modification chaperone [Rhodospirillales bacterium]